MNILIFEHYSKANVLNVLILKFEIMLSSLSGFLFNQKRILILKQQSKIFKSVFIQSVKSIT